MAYGDGEMSICTGRGKDGTTDLLFGKKVFKGDDRVEAGGTLDELNAHIGVVRADAIPESVKDVLKQVQEHLIAIMGEVATETEDLATYAEKGYSKISEEDRQWVVDTLQAGENGEGAIKFKGWARPGAGSVQAAAFLDVCRTVCRRAERQLWAWDEENTYLLHKRYLNNLSDLFWILARESEKEG